jgi:hypothetical protein
MTGPNLTGDAVEPKEIVEWLLSLYVKKAKLARVLRVSRSTVFRILRGVRCSDLVVARLLDRAKLDGLLAGEFNKVPPPDGGQNGAQ